MGRGAVVIAGADGADAGDQFFERRGEQTSYADGEQAAYGECDEADDKDGLV